MSSAKQQKISPPKKPDVYAFIDGNNLHLSIKQQGWKLDYEAFRTYLKDKFHVSKAFYFVGYLQTNASLYKRLQQWGYVLVFKPTLHVRGGVKGNVDAELVLHSMIEYDYYDKAVIVSGDGDFLCLVEYLIQTDKLSKLIVPNGNRYSSLYRKHTKHIMGLDNLRHKLGI